jgi:hypothetical protein
LVANWIPPDVNCPPPTAARPTKKISSGIQNANKILGKLQVPSYFHGIKYPPYSPSNERNNLDATQKTPSSYLKRHLLPKTFKFDKMLRTTDEDIPFDHKPTPDDIAPAN